MFIAYYPCYFGGCEGVFNLHGSLNAMFRYVVHLLSPLYMYRSREGVIAHDCSGQVCLIAHHVIITGTCPHVPSLCRGEEPGDEVSNYDTISDACMWFVMSLMEGQELR